MVTIRKERVISSKLVIEEIQVFREKILYGIVEIQFADLCCKDIKKMPAFGIGSNEHACSIIEKKFLKKSVC